MTTAAKYGINCRMGETRKVTAFLPADLLATAQSYTGEGVTETLRIALERLRHTEWSKRLRALRGKVHLDLDLDELREDREFDEHGNVVN